jgi:hypothetical protein
MYVVWHVSIAAMTKIMSRKSAMPLYSHGITVGDHGNSVD